MTAALGAGELPKGSRRVAASSVHANGDSAGAIGVSPVTELGCGAMTLVTAVVVTSARFRLSCAGGVGVVGAVGVAAASVDASAAGAVEERVTWSWSFSRSVTTVMARTDGSRDVCPDRRWPFTRLPDGRS
ncbi:hypothetical protein TUM20985_33800 [Mycobacterium antarcticum]|nr:hypothetical protein TUM20985_33800 [Mycolicibacterium sp. TUM20985]